MYFHQNEDFWKEIINVSIIEDFTNGAMPIVSKLKITFVRMTPIEEKY
jgi:hypothetical protein